jgi:hypothetical protein
MQGAAGMEAGFGQVLAVRQRRVFFLLVAFLLGPLGVLMTLGGAAMLVGVLLNGTRRGPRPPGFVWTFDLVLLALGIALVFGAHAAVRRARTRVVFQELGAVLTRGKKRVTIAYADAQSFAMRLTHQSYHGMYAGSVVRLTLHADGGRAIDFRGGYKVKASGLLRRKYELLDELERVRQVIADQMADRLIDRMLHAEPVAWGRAILTPEGVVPRTGARRGELIPYSHFQRQSMNGSVLMLSTADARPVLALDTGDVNFWPGYAVFLRLTDLAAAQEVLPGEEAEDGDDVPDYD